MTVTTTPTPTRITHLVGGSPWTGTAERTSPVFNPATGEHTGDLDLASAALVDEVVTSARTAWETSWQRASLTQRTQVLFRFRELLNERKAEIGALITAEHGKVLSDAVGEVTRGLEVAEFACGIPHLLKGGFTENASTSVDVYSIRQSLGVVAVISPFNFPAMVPVSFVGSTAIARYIYETATAHGKRVQALGGAKNHMLVLPDADLDLAADQAINAGFGSAGERCMAISAVVAVGDIGDELVDKIATRARSLRTGDGRRSCDMGPLVTAQARDRVSGYIGAGEAAGATLVVDGREPSVDADGEGFFIGPTLFDHVTPDMTVYTDEIFGPVLSVVRVDSYDEGVKLINDNPYGNGVAIFTNDGGAARQFANEVNVGMIGVNVPVPVPMAYYSFGGWKASLFGDAHAHGVEGVNFFTRGKVVTTRWLDPSHGGINLGFPQNV